MKRYQTLCTIQAVILKLCCEKNDHICRVFGKKVQKIARAKKLSTFNERDRNNNSECQ